MTGEPLPGLLDCKGVMREMGVTRGTAESLMRACDKIIVGRRIFARRDHLAAEVERRTVNASGFPKRAA